MNITPRKFCKLTGLAKECLKGLQQFEVSLEVLHSTQSRFAADLAAAEQAESDYGAAKTARLAAVDAKAATQRKAFKFIMLSRDLLRQKLGTRYSQAWDEVGFVSQTLKIPVLAELQLRHLKSLEMYFTGHPEMEIDGIVSRATAAAMYAAVVQCIGKANIAKSNQRQRRTRRDRASATLRLRVQNLYGELKILMVKDDPRWIQFGFNVPGDKHAAKSAGAGNSTTVG